MYNILQATITECIETGWDLVVREKLIKAQQEAEDIYTGEIYEYKTLNAKKRTQSSNVLNPLLLFNVKNIS